MLIKNSPIFQQKKAFYTFTDPYPLTSLIKTIGGEFSDRQRNANHIYAYTRTCPFCALYRVMT